MLGEIMPQLDVKLNQAVHGNTDTASLHHDDLERQLEHSGSITYPDMRKSWTERIGAVSPNHLSTKSSQGTQYSNEAVLEDAKPNDLLSISQVSKPRELTLNHVKPFRGVLNSPCSPPVHFLTQFNGQTQSRRGVSSRK